MITFPVSGCYTCLLFWLICFSSGFSQTLSSSVTPKAAQEIATKYRLDGDLDSAALWYQKTGKLLLAEENWKKGSQQFLNAAVMFEWLGQNDLKLKLNFQALKIMEEHLPPTDELIGITHFRLFQYYLSVADQEKLRLHANKAREIFTQQPPKIRSKRYVELAEMATALEEDEEAIRYCDSSLLVLDSLPTSNSGHLRMLTLDLQNRIFNRKGQFLSMLKNLEEMNQIAREMGQEELLELQYANKALAYEFLGDLERALSYYKLCPSRRVIDGNISRVFLRLGLEDSAEWYIQKALNGPTVDPYNIEEPSYQGELFRQAADLYAGIQQPGLAETYYQQAIDWFQANEYPVSLAQSYHNWAYFLFQQKQAAKGKPKVQEAIRILKEVESTESQFLSSSFGILGQIEAELGNWTEARMAFDQGIQEVTIVPLSGNQLPKADEVLSPTEYLNLLLPLIRTIYQENPDSTPSLLQALEACQAALQAIYLIRQNIRTTSSKENWAEKAVDVCELGVEISYRLFHKHQQSSYFEQAFLFAEQSKSILLQESLQRSYAMQFAGVPDSLLQKEQQLKIDLAHYWQTYQALSLSAEADSNSLQYAKQELEGFTEQHAQLEEFLEKTYPDYHSLSYDQSIISFQALQSRLTATSTGLIEYVWGEETLYLLGIGASEMVFEKIVLDSLTEQSVINVLEYFHNPRGEQLEKDPFRQLNQLYSWLVAPVLAQLSSPKSLIIVPDGPLGYLPFEMLIREPQSSQPAYLLKQYPISYANSATLLFRGKNNASYSLSFAGFGPSYEGDLTLPYVEQEVMALGQLMRGKSFVRNQATEDHFQTVGASAQVLHLAMHGFPNAEHPTESKLLFYADSSQQLDGNLYAFELYNLSLSAELAVLSACHTGYGPIARGEGIRSLARAFQYAGCPSVMMSLWEANGVVAKDLMPLFYENLKAGLSKDKALQQAKLSYLETAAPHLRDPRMWANFVLIGNAEPLQKNGAGWIWWVLGGIMVLGIGLILIRRRIQT